MNLRHSVRCAFLSALFLVLGSTSLGQTPQARSLWPETPSRLEYRTVSFTAPPIDRQDPRFRVAARGFNLQGGVSLISRDRRLYSIAWIDGSASSGMLRNGPAIVIWPGSHGSQPVGEVRIAQTAELAGGATGRVGRTRQAPSYPDIPGYRYVMSERVTGTRNYLGLWHRIGGEAETLIVEFRPRTENEVSTQRIIGRVPLQLNSIFIYLSLHSVSWDLTVTSQAPVGRPIYILHYRWMPEYFQPLPETSGGRPLAR